VRTAVRCVLGSEQGRAKSGGVKEGGCVRKAKQISHVKAKDVRQQEGYGWVSPVSPKAAESEPNISLHLKDMTKGERPGRLSEKLVGRSKEESIWEGEKGGSR